MCLYRIDVTSEAMLLRDINTRDMLAPFRLGDLGGVLHTVTWSVKTETSLYLRDVFAPRRRYTSEMYLYLGSLFFAGKNKCPRHSSEMFLDPRVSRVNFTPNNDENLRQPI
jgi:hypothetical protein